MTFTSLRRVLIIVAALLLAAALPAKADWPMFGGSASRNFANTAEKNILSQWCIAKGNEQNVKWKATLGGNAFGGPVVAGGRIFIGTNNDRPYDKNITGDKGVLLCLNEADGKFLWQIVHDKLGNSAQDQGEIGVVSTPAVDGDRLYYVSNRCELVCAAAAGDPDRPGKGKIVWSLDMIKTLNVSPGGLEGCVSSGSPLVLDDMVYVITSNGVDQQSGKPAAPRAPSFVAVHKRSGELAWSSNLPGDGILDIQFSSPAAAEINGVKQVIFGGGDGWLYSFEAKRGELLWKFDCNPKDSVFKPKLGQATRNYLLASPVIVDGKVFIGVGREPEAGPGPGHLWCIDAAKKPANKDKDLSPVHDNFDPKAAENKDSGLVWHFGGLVLPKPAGGEREYDFGRTMSTCCVHDGLVYAAELDGYLHCLDAQTGRRHWVHDLGGGVWASPCYVDGKVYMGTDNGDMLVFAAGKEDKLLNTMDLSPHLQSLKVAPVAANGVLYVNTGGMLYAIAPR
jgi:outer membrane protein assembly factor BamB